MQKLAKNLGELYYWGRGVKRDREKSKPFFEKACDKENGQTYGYMGIIYGKFYEREIILRQINIMKKLVGMDIHIVVLVLGIVINFDKA
jgi:TPR repeat protein